MKFYIKCSQILSLQYLQCIKLENLTFCYLNVVTFPMIEKSNGTVFTFTRLPVFPGGRGKDWAPGTGLAKTGSVGGTRSQVKDRWTHFYNHETNKGFWFLTVSILCFFPSIICSYRWIWDRKIRSIIILGQNYGKICVMGTRSLDHYKEVRLCVFVPFVWSALSALKQAKCAGISSLSHLECLQLI